MERLTGSHCKSLMEAYSAVYETTQYQIDEEQVINEFMEFVDILINDGYDLSDCTYDELYEYYLNEGIGSLIKTGLKAAWNIPQAASIRRTLGKKLVQGSVETGGKVVRDVLGGLKNVPTSFWRAGRGFGEKHPKTSAIGLTALGDLALRGPQSVIGTITRGLSNLTSTGTNIPSNIRQGLGGSSEQNSDDKKQKNIKGFNEEESFDMFDVVKKYLLDEGYANTEESAISIMSHMSKEWQNHIINSIME